MSAQLSSNLPWDKIRVDNAIKGDAESQTYVGICLLLGKDGAIEDDNEAFKWLKKAYQGGSIFGKYFLGICYWNGLGTPKNEIKGKKLADEAAEVIQHKADDGDALAQYYLGLIIDLEADDTDTALTYFEKSAQQNNVDALVEAANIYKVKNGEKSQKAFDYYKRALDLNSPIAMYEFANYYMKGLGVDKSNQAALELYKKSADTGYSKAQATLGEFYENCILVEQDLSEAKRWYTKAANQENYKALYNLSLMYRDGFGVDRNYDLALKYMEKANEFETIEAAKELYKLKQRGKQYYNSLPKRADMQGSDLTDNDPFYDIYVGGNFNELPDEMKKLYLQKIKKEKVREWGLERAYKTANHEVEIGFTKDQVLLSQGDNPLIYKERKIKYPDGRDLQIVEYPHCIYYFLNDCLIAMLWSNGVQIGDKTAILTYSGDIVITEN